MAILLLPLLATVGEERLRFFFMVKNLCKVLGVSGIGSFLKGKKGYIYEPRIGNRLFSKIIYFLEEVVKGDLLPLQIGI